MQDLELWGGVECTIHRIGDRWYDQLEGNGHRERLTDLELFAGLGIRRLRQAVLWERHADGGGDWHGAASSLSRLRELGVDPIVGLLHHGSGPAGTSLVADNFAEGLAAHAGRVAQRFPWVEWYTPINEPLTTARFSGLYGWWYPHGRDAATFGRALVNQCRAVVLAMRAIRKVNPGARLLQTEDLGLARSTRRLSAQASFENERRWLTWDLLCGRVDFASPAVDLLQRGGIARDELTWFADNPCPPDVIGINHYVTSDRYLDHRLERYPQIAPGGNGRDRYVDLEAVRAVRSPGDGWARCLDDAWRRYGRPVAITEAHLGCTREQQLRWITAAWHAARDARARGADVRAVTAWALLGSRDWNSLLTRHDDHYESGVFDVRSGEPRPTALAVTLRQLARGEGSEHPAAKGPGWWQRPARLLHHAKPQPRLRRATRQRAVLIVGAAGNLGRVLARSTEARGLAHRCSTRSDLDICDPGQIARVLAELKPWAVINAAGYVRVDEAESEPERCELENVEGPSLLAEACAARAIRFATFSSDLVFDGTRRSPYVESDTPAPLNVYGLSKLAAERAIRAIDPDALIVRTSSFFGPLHPHDFLPVALRAMARGEPFVAMDDVVVSPTYVPDLASACLDLLIDGASGIWHLANRAAISWFQFAQLGANVMGIDASTLIACRCSDLALPARRPAFTALATERGFPLPSIEDALVRYRRESVSSGCDARPGHLPVLRRTDALGCQAARQISTFP